jgi:hypothetical protein
MDPLFVPQTWYWLADDGRVFSGPLEQVVSTSDQGYVDWIALGRYPTEWPREIDGTQTNAMMQTVLAPFGMFAHLSYYSVSVRDRVINGGITVGGLPFATDPITVMSLNSAYIYTIDKQLNEFSWKLPDGTFITLDTDQIKLLQNAVSELGQDCFNTEATLLEGMDAGTVTTREQVDAAYAAIPVTFPAGGAMTFNVRRKAK